MFMVMTWETDPVSGDDKGYPIYRYTGEGTPPYSLVTYMNTQGIKGEKGDKGDTGAQGVQGEQGPKGDKGDKGDQGEQGIQGETGAQGANGTNGTDGVSPVANVTKTDDVIKIHIEDSTGTTEEEIDMSDYAKQTDVDNIQEFIPSDASASNKLVTSNDTSSTTLTSTNTLASWVGNAKGVMTAFIGTSSKPSDIGSPLSSWGETMIWCIGDGIRKTLFAIDFSVTQHVIYTREYYNGSFITNWTAIKDGNLTSTVTSGSTAPVTAGGIYSTFQGQYATMNTSIPNYQSGFCKYVSIGAFIVGSGRIHVSEDTQSVEIVSGLPSNSAIIPVLIYSSTQDADLGYARYEAGSIVVNSLKAGHSRFSFCGLLIGE